MPAEFSVSHSLFDPLTRPLHQARGQQYSAARLVSTSGPGLGMHCSQPMKMGLRSCTSRWRRIASIMEEAFRSSFWQRSFGRGCHPQASTGWLERYRTASCVRFPSCLRRSMTWLGPNCTPVLSSCAPIFEGRYPRRVPSAPSRPTAFRRAWSPRTRSRISKNPDRPS
jgi:hypothetical protein